MPTPLPESAQVIAEVIGRAATLALASKCQYRHCSVPKRPLDNDHWIVRTIGRKKAVELQAVFGGEVVPLATCYAVHQAERDAEIRSALRAGQTPIQIAEAFSLSLKTIQRILDPELAERNRVAVRERKRQAPRGAIGTSDGAGERGGGTAHKPPSVRK